MLERRYKDYDERFAKETVIYVNEDQSVNKMFAYKDPDFTEKILSDDLESIFDEGCIVELRQETFFFHLRPVCFVRSSEPKQSFLMVVLEEVISIYSEDSDFDMTNEH